MRAGSLIVGFALALVCAPPLLARIDGISREAPPSERTQEGQAPRDHPEEPAATVRADSPLHEIIGLWGYGTSFGPMLEGELTIMRDGGTWRATFGGLEAKVEARGDEIVAQFPEGAGKFRGRLVGETIDGFWIRRGVTEDPRFPGGASQAFASPMILAPAGANKWTGDVRPLKVRAKLYLKIFRDGEGRLLGAFRDPYRNDIGGATRFLVTRNGDRVSFSQPNEAGGFDEWFSGTVSDKDSLTIDWEGLGGAIRMKSLAPDDIHVFYPRPAGEPPYVYRKPEAINDGWQTARGRDVGLDEAALAGTVQTIIDGDPAARRPSLVHSILIARKGKLVLEEYFFGHDRETPHDLRSAGKTFASVMLGAAMLKGVDTSPETKVYELLAKRGSGANPDPRKAKITLAHLMTHTSGLDCNDNDDVSLGHEDTLQTQKAEPDWWKYTLDLPMRHEPGARYAYCSANMNLVGAAITDGTKTWLPEFFDRAVARPLGFGRYYWNLTPTEDGYLGGGAWLRPRDLLKVGQAYLDGGVWRGKRIVSAEWVGESTKPRVTISPETTGLSKDEFGNYYGAGEDAYAWHLGAIRVGTRSYPTYEASGNGGQVLFIAPELEMVVVFTGGNYRQGGIWSRWKDELIAGKVLAPMAQQEPPRERKEKVKDGETISRDKSKPVRKGIEEWYARNEEAFEAKDVAAVMALRTDDFHTILPDGTKNTRADMEGYTRRFLERIDHFISLDFEIGTIEVENDLASADVTQRTVRMQRFPDGTLHKVEAGVVQRETWKMTPSGWKLYRVDEIRDGDLLVDDMPYNPDE